MNNQDFSSSIVFYLHQLTLCLDMIGDKVLRENLGITYSQFMILMSAHEFPNSNQQHMVTWLNLTKSTISQNVDILVKKRFLERVPSQANRRENVILNTISGQEVLQKAYTLLLENSNPLFKEMTHRESESLRLLLKNMVDSSLANLLKIHGYLP